MNILNFGSLNIDRVFSVERIVEPGQTIDSLTVNVYPGGKGLNQTLALVRGGANVTHAGFVGADGHWLTELLAQEGVNCRFIRTGEKNTGSAFIQVDTNGQNSIVLDGGANREITPEFCREVLGHFREGDLLLLQNEISCVGVLIELAFEKGLKIVLNPSPMNAALLAYSLEKVSIFIMNEDEGKRLTGERDDEGILNAMRERCPRAQTVLTLGVRGALYQCGENRLYRPAFRVKALDTTAAGDTFTGYFLAALSRGEAAEDCLTLAAKASALSVMRKGAASSIPCLAEVERAVL